MHHESRVIVGTIAWVGSSNVWVANVVVVQEEPVQRGIRRDHRKVLVADVGDEVDGLGGRKGALIDVGKVKNELRPAVQVRGSLTAKFHHLSARRAGNLPSKLTPSPRSVCLLGRRRWAEEKREQLRRPSAAPPTHSQQPQRHVHLPRQVPLHHGILVGYNVPLGVLGHLALVLTEAIVPGIVGGAAAAVVVGALRGEPCPRAVENKGVSQWQVPPLIRLQTCPGLPTQ